MKESVVKGKLAELSCDVA